MKFRQNFKNREIFEIFCHFCRRFGSFSCHFRQTQKCPKVSTNTYRTKLNLCELNSVSDSLQFEYIFGTEHILFRKTIELNLFLSHMGYERKTITINISLKH